MFVNTNNFYSITINSHISNFKIFLCVNWDSAFRCELPKWERKSNLLKWNVHLLICHWTIFVLWEQLRKENQSDSIESILIKIQYIVLCNCLIIKTTLSVNGQYRRTRYIIYFSFYWMLVFFFFKFVLSHFTMRCTSFTIQHAVRNACDRINIVYLEQRLDAPTKYHWCFLFLLFLSFFDSLSSFIFFLFIAVSCEEVQLLFGLVFFFCLNRCCLLREFVIRFDF